MTILFLTRLFYPHIGGVEKHVLEISKRLMLVGHKVIIITEHLKTSQNNNSEANNKFELFNGIHIYRIDVGKESWFKKFRIWWNLWKLRTLILESDLIHCHDVFFWYVPFRFLYPLKRAYTTFHGYESYPVTKKAIMIRKISEKLSWGNICIGEFMKKWYGSKPDYISYGAVEINEKKDRSVSFQKINKESALFYGRLDSQTGILTYAKTFEIIKVKHPNFKLLVIGDGIYKSSINKNILSLTFQSQPERYFKNYHFAFLSRYLSILEAFAAGKLVFAVYDNPLKEDYLKMSPFAQYIIIENNAQSLADKISYYLNHPKIEEKLTDDAYNWVKHQTWDAMINIYLSLWKKSVLQTLQK